MSGCSYATICPRCGAENLQCRSDTKPYDSVAGECLECGFEYHTSDGRMTLEEVNQERQDYELEPLTKLREPTPEWAMAVGRLG